jgi:hypothetical protein
MFYSTNLTPKEWVGKQVDPNGCLRLALLILHLASRVSFRRSVNKRLRLGGLVVLGYGVYLFQASKLYGFNYMTSRDKSIVKFWRGYITTFLYVAWLFYFSNPLCFLNCVA